MKPRDYIQRFCANPAIEIRPYLNKPTRSEGNLYASNGHILIVTEDDEAVIDAETEAMDLIIASRTIVADALNAFPHMTPLRIELPPAEPCESCNGIGREKDCPNCAGEGCSEDQCGTCPACGGTCHTCGGAGELVAEDGDRPCWDCGGLKIKLNQTIPYGGSHFARRYLALLLELPGIRFTANPETPETGCAYFRFDGGYGALMPCRP